MKKITLLFILCIAFNWQSNAQLTEDFEGGVVPPAGWTSYAGLAPSVAGTEVWEVNADANTGTNAAFVGYDFSNPGLDKEDWLVTSAVDLTAITASELRFFAKQQYTALYNSTYEIRVSTTSQTDHTTFVAVSGGFWDETTLNTTLSYEEKVVNLSDFDGEATVYVAFIHTNDDGDSWYLDDITIAASSTCEAPAATYVSNITVNTADLGWGSVALEVGGYDWRVMNFGDNVDVDTPVDSGSVASGVTSDSASGLVGSSAYHFYVRTICAGGPTSWTVAFPFNTPPGNDLACNAMDLTSLVGVPSTGGAYSNAGATIEVNETSGNCWAFGDTTDQSVWFKFTTAGAEVTLTTDYSNGGSADDTQFTLFSTTDCGDHTTFTEVACNDDISGSNFLSEIVITLAAGTYYLQVDLFGTGTEGTFDIGYFDPSLSNDTFEEETALSYFPNPVNDKLTLRAQQNIQNVSVLNMLGQEVMSRTNINAQTRELDLSALQAGAYFVRVSINDTVETLKILKK